MNKFISFFQTQKQRKANTFYLYQSFPVMLVYTFLT